MPQKNYPKEKFLKLAEKLAENISIIWGNKNEKEVGEWLSKNSKYISLAPKMSLDQLKYYISTSKMVIGNDTGPTHLAWAMNIKSTIIFGLTPVEQALKTDINFIVKSNSPVNHRKIDKKDFSIRDIEIDEVLKTIKK